MTRHARTFAALRLAALAVATTAALGSTLGQSLPAAAPASPATVVDLEYDAGGQPTLTVVDKAGQAVTSRQHYNALGQLTGWTDARGVKGVASFDAANRLTQIAYTQGTSSESYTWTYDQATAAFDADIEHMSRYPLGQHIRDVTYDSAGRISDDTHDLSSSGAATLRRSA